MRLSRINIAMLTMAACGQSMARASDAAEKAEYNLGLLAKDWQLSKRDPEPWQGQGKRKKRKIK